MEVEALGVPNKGDSKNTTVNNFPQTRFHKKEMCLYRGLHENMNIKKKNRNGSWNDTEEQERYSSRFIYISDQ